MRSLPIILTLLLTAAWAYTSWYWYTCNIKWLCESSNSSERRIWEKSEEKKMVTGKDVIVDSTPVWNEEVISEIETNREEAGSIDDTTQEENPDESETEGTEGEWENNPESSEIQDLDESTLETESTSSNIQEEEDTEIDWWQEATTQEGAFLLCDTPLLGPIALWENNNTTEVEKLETFLKAQGKDITIDGVYDSSDLDLVKEFQLEYKSEILDPWGITVPTGYVGRTTVKQINDIACK